MGKLWVEAGMGTKRPKTGLGGHLQPLPDGPIGTGKADLYLD